MKNTFLALFAVIATASFTQASELQPKATVQYTVTTERLDFMVQRIGAVVQEEIARSKAQPNPATAIADEKVQPKAEGRVAIAKDAKRTVELAGNHS